MSDEFTVCGREIKRNGVRYCDALTNADALDICRTMQAAAMRRASRNERKHK